MRRLSERLNPQDYSRIAADGAQEDIAAARLLENWIATVEGHVGSSLRRGRNGNSEGSQGSARRCPIKVEGSDDPRLG